MPGRTLSGRHSWHTAPWRKNEPPAHTRLRRPVAAAFNRHGFGALGPVFESLGGRIDYGRLRLFRASISRQ